MLDRRPRRRWIALGGVILAGAALAVVPWERAEIQVTDAQGVPVVTLAQDQVASLAATLIGREAQLGRHIDSAALQGQVYSDGAATIVAVWEDSMELTALRYHDTSRVVGSETVLEISFERTAEDTPRSCGAVTTEHVILYNCFRSQWLGDIFVGASETTTAFSDGRNSVEVNEMSSGFATVESAESSGLWGPNGQDPDAISDGGVREARCDGSFQPELYIDAQRAFIVGSGFPCGPWEPKHYPHQTGVGREVQDVRCGSFCAMSTLGWFRAGSVQPGLIRFEISSSVVY